MPTEDPVLLESDRHQLCPVDGPGHMLNRGAFAAKPVDGVTGAKRVNAHVLGPFRQWRGADYASFP